MTWNQISRNGIHYYQDPNLNNTRVVQACSSSDCGDLGAAGTARVGPARRQAFLANLGLRLDDLVAAQQVHGIQVQLVDRNHGGAGSGLGPAPLAGTDGLITATPGVVLSIYSADCLPLFIYDPQTPAVAAIHAGWRGSLQQIAAAAMNFMSRELGTLPAHCWAAIGPGLCRDCFVVQPQLAEEFARLWPAAVRRGQAACRVDLARVNREQLETAGIRPERINSSGLCTCCQPTKFFSHRAQSGTSRRLMGLIALQV